MHAIKELAWLMKDRLYKNDIEGFASLVDQSWQEKIKTSTTITNPEIDHLFAVAKENGAIGGKITGAGGGGFMMLFCPPERRSGVLQALDSEQGTVYPFCFSSEGPTLGRSTGAKTPRKHQPCELSSKRSAPASVRPEQTSMALSHTRYPSMNCVRLRRCSSVKLESELT